jgi:hypothetical protein
MYDFAEDLVLTVEGAAPRLLGLTEADSSERPAPGAWSKKETLGHLVDSAANNHRRFVLAQLHDGLDFEGYAQEGWINVQHYNDEPWPQLVALWRHYNLHLAHVMSRAPHDKLRREHRLHTLDRIAFELVEQGQPATLEYLMRDYVTHLKHHLAQIFGEGEKG